jgi:hypothetical protein
MAQEEEGATAATVAVPQGLERTIEFVMRWSGFHRIKIVGVSPQVPATYHKSPMLYGELPLSGRLRYLIRIRNIIYVWYVVSCMPDYTPSFIANSVSLCVRVYACTYIAHICAYIHAYTYTSR